MINFNNQTTGIIDQLSTPLLVSIYICSLVGIIFNIAICLIIWNRKHLHLSLNLLIANLALSDIGYCLTSIYSATLISLRLYNPLILIQLPSVNFDIICKSINFLGILFTGSSMITLAMISIERFHGIIYPLKRQFSQRQNKFTIAFIWIYSLIPAALLICFSSFESHKEFDCTVILASQIKIIDIILTFLSGVMCCIIPLIVIITCYASIAVKIFRKAPPIDDSEYKNKVMKSISKRNQYIIILLTITIISSFASCPFLVILNWIMFNKLTDPQIH